VAERLDNLSSFQTTIKIARSGVCQRLTKLWSISPSPGCPVGEDAFEPRIAEASPARGKHNA
jgi:hypothetical protein